MERIRIDSIIRYKGRNTDYRVLQFDAVDCNKEGEHRIVLQQIDGTIYIKTTKLDSFEESERSLKEFFKKSPFVNAYFLEQANIISNESLQLPLEIWYNLEELSVMYQVSNFGRVKMLDPTKENGSLAILNCNKIQLPINSKVQFRYRYELIYEIVENRKLERFPAPDNFVEEFKDISECEGRYQISNLGRVNSIYKTRKGLENTTLKISKQTVRLFNYKSNQYQYFSIKLLVGRKFLPNPYHYKYLVRKNPMDVENNYVGNLEWSPEDNSIKPKESQYPFIKFDEELNLWISEYFLENDNNCGVLYFFNEDSAINACTVLQEQGIILKKRPITQNLSFKSQNINTNYFTNNVVIYVELGNQSYLNNNFQKAIEYYTKALNKNAHYRPAYVYRGDAKDEINDYTGAIEDYTRAIEIDPDYADAFYNRGCIKHKVKDNQGAIDDYTKAIEIDPDNADAFYNRGCIKHKVKDNQGAIDDYTKAIEIDPDNADAIINRGCTKHNLKDYKGAIDDYTKAIEIDPSKPNAYLNRGNAKKALKEYQEAIYDYTKAIEIDPSYAKAFTYRGNTRKTLKDYKGAIDDYTKAIEIDPSNANAFHNRGATKKAIGDYEGAENDFRRCSELKWDKSL